MIDINQLPTNPALERWIADITRAKEAQMQAKEAQMQAKAIASRAEWSSEARASPVRPQRRRRPLPRYDRGVVGDPSRTLSVSEGKRPRALSARNSGDASGGVRRGLPDDA